MSDDGGQAFPNGDAVAGMSLRDYFAGRQACNELQKRMEPDEILERAAAALWRAENPDVSVFACDVSMKVKYRDRVKDDALNQVHIVIDEYYNGDRACAERWLLRAYEVNQKVEPK